MVLLFGFFDRVRFEETVVVCGRDKPSWIVVGIDSGDLSYWFLSQVGAIVGGFWLNLTFFGGDCGREGEGEGERQVV